MEKLESKKIEFGIKISVLVAELEQVDSEERRKILKKLFQIALKTRNKSYPLGVAQEAILDCLAKITEENIDTKKDNLQNVFSDYIGSLPNKNQNQIDLELALAKLEKLKCKHKSKEPVPRYKKDKKGDVLLLYNEITKAVFIDIPKDLRRIIYKYLKSFDYNQLVNFVSNPGTILESIEEKDKAFMTLVVKGFENLNQPTESN